MAGWGCIALGWPVSPAAAAPDPGLIYVHTVRGDTTVQNGNAASRPLQRWETLAATAQWLQAPQNQPLVLVLSNGSALCLPEGGKLRLEEFVQEPVKDTSTRRLEEPTRSTLRLNLESGALAFAGRTPVPTSTFAVTTPLAQLNCLASSLVVVADANALTVTVFSGVVKLSIASTSFTETLQTGQTATLAREDAAKAFPLKLMRITAGQEHEFGAWLEVARWAEARVDFVRTDGPLRAQQVVPQPFTQKISVDEPRYR